MSTLVEAAREVRSPALLKRCRCGHLSLFGVDKSCITCVFCGTPPVPEAVWAADPNAKPRPSAHRYVKVSVPRADGSFRTVEQCERCTGYAS